MKKRTALKAASLAMAAAMLAACGGSAAGTAASTATGETTDATASVENDGYNADLTDIIPEDTVTLTVYSQLANYSGEMIGWFAQVLKDKFNVKLNIIPESDGTFATRMEGGNLGDIIIWGGNTDQYLEAANKGKLLDWNEDDLLTDYGPYIAAHMQPALEKNAQISGGTTYGVGYDVGVNATDISAFVYNWGLRWDLYKEMGYPETQTLDDYADMLIEMNQKYPTDESGKKNYAVSLFKDWDGDMAMFPKALVTAYYGYDEFGVGFYDPSTKTYIPAVAEDSPYVEALKFYNKLYQAGAMDPDSETQGYDGCNEDYQNGNAFFNQFNFLGNERYNSDDHLSAGKAMYPVLPTEAKPINYGQNIYGNGRYWTIGADTEYPELCMAIINWLCTPEGTLTNLYGPKDACWYYDDNKGTCLTDLGKACITDASTQMSDGYSGSFKDGQNMMNNNTWARDAKNPDSNGEDYNWQHWASNKTEAQYDIEQDWRDKTGADSIDDYLANRGYTLSVGSTYSATPKSDELTVTWNQVTDCIKTYSWKAMFAASDAEFDSIISEMIEKANSYGLDQCNEYEENEAALRKTAEEAALAE